MRCERADKESTEHEASKKDVEQRRDSVLEMIVANDYCG